MNNMPSNAFTDVSQITEYLYLSAWPRGEHAQEIKEMGIRLILSMHWRRPQRTLGHAPVRLLWLPSIDSPYTPIPMGFLVRGVEAALPVIGEGGKVLVHCKYGVHRSVAMTCCVLIGTGYSPAGAMQLVKEKRSVADPYVGYVRKRILEFDQVWQKRKLNPTLNRS
jgi:hypothetical protein